MQNRSSFDALPAIYEEYGDLTRLYRPEAETFELQVFDLTHLHYHNSLELGLCTGGKGECYVEDRVFPFEEGDVQIIFPYQRHYNRSDRSDPSWWYFVNLDLPTLLPEMGFFDPMLLDRWLQQEMGLFGIFTAEAHPEVHRLVQVLMEEMLRKGEPEMRYREMCGGLLCQLLCQLSRESREVPKLSIQPNPLLERVAPALEEIQRQLNQGSQPSVEALAACCTMSEPHFRRVFHQATGSAPKEYILCAAIHRAERLLLTTGLGVTQISQEVGFSDVSGFNRRFIRQNGLPPAAFRRLYRR